MSNESIILAAIKNKDVVQFSYHDYPRIAEPHILGTHEGKTQVLFYQIGGESSSGGIPEWRRMNLDEISDLETTGQKFAGRRPYPSGKHSEWDTRIAIVD